MKLDLVRVLTLTVAPDAMVRASEGGAQGGLSVEFATGRLRATRGAFSRGWTGRLPPRERRFRRGEAGCDETIRPKDVSRIAGSSS